MKECKKCGAEFSGPEAHRHEDICPSCGLTGGAQAITDLPPAGIRKADRELAEETRNAREEAEQFAAATCRNCGADITAPGKHRHEEVICPSCGTAPGIESMTDLPRANVREAHRKLKAEIKEIREQKKRGED